MASQKNLDKKQVTINEIQEKFQNSSSFLAVDYQGVTVADTNQLRRSLKEVDAEFKIYKNTLTKRALDSINVDLSDHLVNAKAFVFGKDPVSPIKILSEFSKKNKNLQIKTGVIDGSIVDIKTIEELASIPSREGLLTMLAGGLIAVVKDLSISLDLYSQNLEK